MPEENRPSFIPKWIWRRISFFKWWIGVYFFASGSAILYSIFFMEEQSYRVAMGCFGQFWVSVGLYKMIRDPIKAEKAVWDAVEKDQKKEKVENVVSSNSLAAGE